MHGPPVPYRVVINQESNRVSFAYKLHGRPGAVVDAAAAIMGSA